MKSILILTLVILVGCVPLDQSSNANFVPKTIEFTDKNYDNSVGTVLLYNQNVLNPPITTLNSNNSLKLEFDLLTEDFEYLNAKLYYCDAQWRKSRLSDLEFVDQFNEFPINDYFFSENSITTYTNYRFNVPTVNLSGNYVLAVYRGNNSQDLLFTRRFMVKEDLIAIEADVKIPDLVHFRRSGQKIDFSLEMPNLNVRNAETEVTTVIRQNGRWDNAKFNLKPTQITAQNNSLNFDYFNGESTFWAGNELRIFDLRTTSFTGMNIAKISLANNRRFAIVTTAQPSNNNYYSVPLNEDINGKFFIKNLEPASDDLDADYIYTTFTLIAPKDAYGDIYVLGEFNNWKTAAENRMLYDETLGAYRLEKRLKQGFYNYTFYAPAANNPYPVDGSFFETENDYEILVYHREIGTYFDRLVGYKQISSRN